MSQPLEEGAIRDVWSNYWASVDNVAPWDTLSEIILASLQRECRSLSDTEILEAGCGTGRISHRLALAGAKVTCLDITQEALDLAQTVFGETPCQLRLGSILDMPKDAKSDLVWNAGVIEHFTTEDQRLAISEFLAILNPGGKVVIYTPYSRSPVYRLGKFILECLGRWPYGVEIPKHTLADCLPQGARLHDEHTICFLPLLFDSHKFLTPLRRPLRWLWTSMLKRFGREKVVTWDRTLSRYLGGYLLVSVITAD